MIPLPPKETSLYGSLPKLFEFKQYKRGLKVADHILKKFPEHGETLALKGLMLDHLNRREEALDFIRKGIRFDLNSHVCWHVYGLYYRTGKEYEEAAKCYLTALKHDKDNLQILRDLALMQMQIRDFDGYFETRQHLLNIRPDNRVSWIGLAVAYHMLNDHTSALRVLEAFMSTLSSKEKEHADSELTELLFYQVELFLEAKRPTEALALLKSVESSIHNIHLWRDMLARTLCELGKFDEALSEYRMLFSVQSENAAHLNSIIRCQQKLSAQEDPASIVMKLRTMHPSSALVAQKCLEVLPRSNSFFVAEMTSYLEKGITKGIPSLFISLKGICESDPEKCQFIETYMLEQEKLQGPEELAVWVWLYLAQHYDMKRNTVLAMDYSQRAINKVPTSPDAHRIHAKILKHAGAARSASISMNFARDLDKSDRYLNTLCVKYMLHANRTSDAESTVMLFAKNDKSVLNLVDMQAIWFARASARCAWESGKYGLALKKMHLIDKFFSDFFDDQFDFHAYCLRKMTLCSYIRFLKFEDELREHIYYRSMAHDAVKIYLELYDRPKTLEKPSLQDDNPQMSEAEKKKMLSKLRRAEMRSKAESDAAAAATTTISPSSATTATTNVSSGIPKDEDPEGEEYVRPGTDFLKEAIKFLRPFLFKENKDVETWILAAEIYRRKMERDRLQPLALLRALLAIKDHVDAFPQAYKNLVLSSKLLKGYIDPSSEVQTVVEEMIKTLGIPQKSWQCTQSFSEKHENSLPHRIAVAQILHGEDPIKAKALIISSCIKDAALADCREAHRVLSSEFNEVDAAADWSIRCSENFPYSDYFHRSK